MRYSVEPQDRIYVKDYRFLSFAKVMGKILITTTELATDALKTTLKRASSRISRSKRHIS